MAKFTYTVQDAQGSTTTGVLDAASEDEAATTLQSRGLFILAIQPERADQVRKAFSKFGGGRVSGRDLVFFGEQLSTLLNGGVPLVRSLTLLADNATSRPLGAALHAITRDVAAGSQFYQAMARHTAVFSNLWVSLIQAGEISGQLPRSLKQIASYMEAQEEMKGKILTALMYPAVLFLISMGVLAFFVIKIVPTFTQVFESFDLDLPALTLSVMFLSTLLTKHLILLIVVVCGLALLLRAYSRTESGQLVRATLQMKVPLMGNFIRHILLERMLTTMTALLQSGVSILNALTVLETVFSTNFLFRNALRAVRNDVAQGKAISASFQKTGLLPPISTQMMLMGEESGKLPEIVQTLANFYRGQVESFVRRFTSVIDPIMIVAIGGIVGVIVLSIFLPIFEISQLGIKGR